MADQLCRRGIGEIAADAAQVRADRVVSGDNRFALDLEHAVDGEERDELVETTGIGVVRVGRDDLADRLTRDQFRELHSRNVAARSASAKLRAGSGRRGESYMSMRGPGFGSARTIGRGRSSVRSVSNASRTSANAADPPP